MNSIEAGRFHTNDNVLELMIISKDIGNHFFNNTCIIKNKSIASLNEDHKLIIQGGMIMKDIITVSTVTFNATWGEKTKNLNRIKGYIKAASKKGADIVIFPEMALTGYDDEEEKEKKDKMHSIEAELIPEPSTNEVAELTKKLGIYAGYRQWFRPFFICYACIARCFSLRYLSFVASPPRI